MIPSETITTMQVEHDDDHQDAAEDLDLGPDATGGQVVLHGHRVPGRHQILHHLDEPDDEPGDRGDQSQADEVAQDRADLGGQRQSRQGHGDRDERKHQPGCSLSMLHQRVIEQIAGAPSHTSHHPEDDRVTEKAQQDHPGQDAGGYQPDLPLDEKLFHLFLLLGEACLSSGRARSCLRYPPGGREPCDSLDRLAERPCDSGYALPAARQASSMLQR